jgi:hypothetical protein
MGSRTENDSALLRPQTTNFINAAFSVFPKNESHSSRATEALVVVAAGIALGCVVAGFGERTAPVRHLIEIPRATHFVEVETGRDVLFREVQSFLDRN